MILFQFSKRSTVILITARQINGADIRDIIKIPVSIHLLPVIDTLSMRQNLIRTSGSIMDNGIL